MAEPIFGVYGASGYGREVMPVVRSELENLSGSYEDRRLVFIDDDITNSEINGHSVLPWEKFIRESASSRSVVIAVADSVVRERLTSKCEAAGVSLFSVRANNVVILDQVSIGVGALLSPFVTLTSNIVIGKSFQANLYSYVGHDCVIGKFVTFAPNVCCNGNVHIEDHAYIGTGAVIKQGSPAAPLVIGHGAVVGMGAVVTKSVPAGATVVGNPARVLAKA